MGNIGLIYFLKNYTGETSYSNVWLLEHKRASMSGAFRSKLVIQFIEMDHISDFDEFNAFKFN